jgi:hypothetical protein
LFRASALTSVDLPAFGSPTMPIVSATGDKPKTYDEPPEPAT